MPTKFPQAYNRFEEARNVSHIKTFNQLLFEFSTWQHYQVTQRQSDALKEQSKTLNLKTKTGREYKQYRSWGTGRYTKEPPSKKHR